MVRIPGSKHSAASSRVTARRNDWNSIRDLHQGPRSQAASRGRIHDRSTIRLPKHQKSLAERGPSIHDVDGHLLPDHLFKKFSGRPGRAQSIATSWPLPDSVMWAVFSSGPPKAMLVVTRS